MRHYPREFAGCLPDEIFDIHAHLFRWPDMGLNELPDDITRDKTHDASAWAADMAEAWAPARAVGGLWFPYPTPKLDISAANEFLAGEISSHPESRGLYLATPKDDPDAMEARLRPGIAGFKVYHWYGADQGATGDLPISAFLPEWAWRLADKHGLALMAHLVRGQALADPENLDALRAMCERYPKAKLILAHAGRGFHAPNTVKAASALARFENVWFDTSVIAEPAPLRAILDHFGPRRLLWGSDWPVCGRLTRAVTAGDGFIWLDEGDYQRANVSPRPAGYEATMALIEAGRTFGLNRADWADIFANNARRLLNMPVAGEDGNRAQRLYRRAKQIIPAGTQLLSKRPELAAPSAWPPYFREARGCEVWDVDGRRYFDVWTMGIGACLLGYRDPDVTAAATRRINLGAMSTLNPPEEVELAERLLAIHPWAGQARFTRTGGTAAAVAVRIARATTRRDGVAICGYHGWHDWYLASNLGETDALKGIHLPGLEPAGVPSGLRGTASTFHYGDLQEFLRLIEAHGDTLAAVVMEPARHHDPAPGYLERIREETRRRGILLIFDEITIGFRRNFGGLHRLLGVQPDMALFAKALGNGHPIGAVIGTTEAMEGAHGSFISSTYWTESVGPAAAVATLEKMESLPDLPGYLERMGRLAEEAWREGAAKAGLDVEVGDGFPCLAMFKFRHPDAQAMRTFYTRKMLDRGFLASAAFYASWAHTEAVMRQFREAVRESFIETAKAVRAGTLEKDLGGKENIAHTGFARLN